MNNRITYPPAARYIERYREILGEMIEGMLSAELTDSISHNFIVQMIPHHEAAIEMSRNLLEYSSYTPLRRVAENIIYEQTKSISNMNAAFQSCSELVNCENDLAAYQYEMWRIMRLMFFEMNCAYEDNYINCDFMREMIPHHQGAVRMAQNALKYCICPELQPILQEIIILQQRGIRQMTDLYGQLNCSAIQIASSSSRT